MEKLCFHTQTTSSPPDHFLPTGATMPVFSKFASDPLDRGRPQDPRVAKAMDDFLKGRLSRAQAAAKFKVKINTLHRALARLKKRPAPAAAPDQPPLKRTRETFVKNGINVRMSDRGPVMADTKPTKTLMADGKKRRFNKRHEVRRAICITNNFMTANYAKAFIAAQEMLKNERTKPWKERRTVAHICRCVRKFAWCRDGCTTRPTPAYPILERRHSSQQTSTASTTASFSPRPSKSRSHRSV